MLKFIKGLMDGIKSFWRYLQEKGKTAGTEIAARIFNLLSSSFFSYIKAQKKKSTLPLGR